MALQRVDGAARLAYARGADGVTRLADLYQRAPCRVLFPDVEPDEPRQAVLLTTSGGLTGGDRLSVALEARAHARVTVTTQAAEKIYRAQPNEAPAQIDIRIEVADNAWMEYLAQETLLFDNARLRRRLHADIAPGARLLAVESLVFGRTAMGGERFEHGFLHDAWRIRRGGRLIWADALHLDGAVGAIRRLPFGFGQARASASLIYVGDDAGALLAPLRERLRDYAQAAATSFDGLLILRLLADDAVRLRAVLMIAVGFLRELAAGLSPRLPRVWTC